MSERGFSSGMEAVLESKDAALALAVYLDWPTAPVRFWTGEGTIDWDSEDWIGAGKWGGISPIVDTADKADVGIELTLNYLDDDIRNEVNTENLVGLDGRIYLWTMNLATAQVVDSYQLFTGFVDRISMLDGGQSGQITVRLASERARLKRVRAYCLSDAHQQHLFPGDRGCEYAARMDQTIYWGRKPLVPIVPRIGYDNWEAPP